MRAETEYTSLVVDDLSDTDDMFPGRNTAEASHPVRAVVLGLDFAARLNLSTARKALKNPTNYPRHLANYKAHSLQSYQQRNLRRRRLRPTMAHRSKIFPVRKRRSNPKKNNPARRHYRPVKILNPDFDVLAAQILANDIETFFYLRLKTKNAPAAANGIQYGIKVEPTLKPDCKNEAAPVACGCSVVAVAGITRKSTFAV